MEQLPQFPWSVCVSTQIPLHNVEPVGHNASQLPALQCGVAAEHAWPQLPQLLASTSVLTHVPSQLSVDDADAQHAFAAPSPLESVLDNSPAEQIDVNVYEISSYELTLPDVFLRMM